MAYIAHSSLVFRINRNTANMFLLPKRAAPIGKRYNIVLRMVGIVLNGKQYRNLHKCRNNTKSLK